MTTTIEIGRKRRARMHLVDSETGNTLYALCSYSSPQGPVPGDIILDIATTFDPTIQDILRTIGISYHNNQVILRVFGKDERDFVEIPLIPSVTPHNDDEGEQ